jgi:hypothetical protein
VIIISDEVCQSLAVPSLHETIGAGPYIPSDIDYPFYKISYSISGSFFLKEMRCILMLKKETPMP